MNNYIINILPSIKELFTSFDLEVGNRFGKSKIVALVKSV